MTPQTPVLKYLHQRKREAIAVPHCPHPPRTFFERFGPLGKRVLPDKVLDNTPLVDPETGIPQPSLRQQCSSQGLCYARVLNTFAEGLYWADVAATSDLAATEHVVLTEEHLTFALAWDERLQKKDAAQIRRLMRVHARKLAPLRPRTKSVPATDLLPAPFADLRADEDEADQLCSVEVTVNDVPEALRQEDPAVLSTGEPTTAGSHSYMHIKPVAPYTFQQVLLRTMRKVLQRQLAQTRKQARALELKARWALVARVQDWQRQTRQRVVHVEECRWCAVRKCWVWNLTLRIPKSLLAEFASAA